MKNRLERLRIKLDEQELDALCARLDTLLAGTEGNNDELFPE